jgi:hypothetical protein
MVDLIADLRAYARERYPLFVVIAQNARILVPVPEAKNAKNPDNVEAAMTLEEATALADAKAKGAKILCLARSGLPGGDLGVFEKPAEPSPVDTIQVINHDKSSTTFVPAGNNGPPK